MQGLSSTVTFINSSKIIYWHGKIVINARQCQGGSNEQKVAFR